MKKIAMVRHAQKDGEFIAASAISSIIENGIPCLNTLTTDLIEFADSIHYHMGSKLERTAQTMMAYLIYSVDHSASTIIFPPESRFGNKEMFTAMTSNAAVAEKQKTVGWHAALEEFEPAFLKQLQQDAAQALKEIFNRVEENSLIIMIGHTPMIEITAAAVDSSFDPSLPLKELEGVVITFDGEEYKAERLAS